MIPCPFFRLKDEKSGIKTLWPVCCREFLFLPEFKVHNEDLTAKYEIIDYIASGSFGKVYKVRQHNTNDVFALKILEKSKVSGLVIHEFLSAFHFPYQINIKNNCHTFCSTDNP